MSALSLYFQKFFERVKEFFLKSSRKEIIVIPLHLNVTVKKRIITDYANDEDVVGTIKLFAGATPPKSWKFCDGSLLLICSYPELYRVIGSMYGGDGIRTFALPDLRGRTAVGSGKGQGLSHRHLSQVYGTETVIIDVNQLPIAISDNVSRAGKKADNQSVSKVSQQTEVNNMQPSLTLNYIICCEGRPLIL